MIPSDGSGTALPDRMPPPGVNGSQKYISNASLTNAQFWKMLPPLQVNNSFTSSGFKLVVISTELISGPVFSKKRFPFASTWSELKVNTPLSGVLPPPALNLTEGSPQTSPGG